MGLTIHRATCPSIPLRQLHKILIRAQSTEELDEPTARKVLTLLVEIYESWPGDMEFPVELSELWFEARKVAKR